MEIIKQLQLVKKASQSLRSADTAQKNIFLERLADLLVNNSDEILRENLKDLVNASALSLVIKNRLALTAAGIDRIALGVKQVAQLNDPVGQVASGWVAANGLKVKRIRVPIGVIFFVFESRPNVIVDAAALAIKSGNALIARGGKEALFTNNILGKLIQDALLSANLPAACFQSLSDKSHEAIYEVVRASRYVDLAVARGREQLIAAVKEHARVPVIAHERGLCSVYIDEFADKNKAIAIAVNAKISNPAVCNAAETILVHERVVENILPELLNKLIAAGVEVRGDAIVCRLDSRCKAADERDWDTEFLDLIVAIKIVKDSAAALDHIEQHGSRHSDVIITENKIVAEKFVNEINNAAVLVNASTRLVDGNILGLGAEFGISTASVHMRGPMGLEDLTVTKYLVAGDGQIRQ